MQEQYFKAVPVSEKPDKEGWYRFIDEKGYTRDDQYYFQNGEWYSSVIENNFCPPTYKVDMKDEGYTHYLQPIKLPDAERLRESAIAFMSTIPIDNNNIYLVGFDEALKKLREALAATGDGWVRCEDRFPEAEDADERGFVMTYKRDDRQWGWPTSQGFSKWKRVTPSTHTHWRPLPSPPIK